MKQNKIKKELKRSTAIILAFLLASMCSVAVYATVSYDSSKDPVVSLSGMQAYVKEKIDELKSTVSSIDLRLQALELAFSTGDVPSGGGSGSGIGSEALQGLIDRVSDLEDKTKELEDANASLKNELDNAKAELNDLIGELQIQYAAICAELGSLEDQISTLQGQLTSLKSDVSTLSKNFKQISDISTKLETLTYKVNNLTSSSGDIGVLKKQCNELKDDISKILDQVGKLYEPVFVPYGATVKAANDEDSVLVVLRSGAAVAVSPFNDAGTAQGLNDLSDGSELYDGDALILFHNVMIPRGGEDGRGVTVTSFDGAYLMIGGNYVIIQP